MTRGSLRRHGEDGIRDGGTVSLFVRRLSSFAQLGPVATEAVHAILSRPMQFSTNGDIVIEGVPTTSYYVIERGWACTYKLLRDGKRQILSFLLPGDHTAQGEIVADRPSSSVSALTPVVVRPCPVSSLGILGERHAPLRQALDGARQLDMATLRDHLVNIGRRDAYQRLAYLIVELYYRLRIVGLAKASSFELPITQEMVADSLGLSNVHVNRTLRRLSENNVACLKGDHLTIFDWDALVDIAEFHESYLGQFARAKEMSNHNRASTLSLPGRRSGGETTARDVLLASTGEPG